MKVKSIRFGGELEARVNEFAAAHELSYGGAVKVLIARGLGDAREVALMQAAADRVHGLLQKKTNEIAASIRSQLLEALDEIAPEPRREMRPTPEEQEDSGAGVFYGLDGKTKRKGR